MGRAIAKYDARPTSIAVDIEKKSLSNSMKNCVFMHKRQAHYRGTPGAMASGIAKTKVATA
jgi:hypothetical protein